jgi:hypothetical protein
MSLTRISAAAAALALVSGVAMAQTMTPSASTTTNPAAPPSSTLMPDPSSTAVNPATTPSATTSATDTSGVVMMSSQSPEAQATLKAGDANVVSNGPVADTPENRAKYGGPESRTGRRTAARGN